MKREVGAVEKRTCLLVLGMHRSGTSALTRVLSLAGAALPKRLLGANEESNLAGHWEPDALIQYHDRLLAELASSWDDWQALNIDTLPVKRREEIRQEIGEIITADFGDASFFVLKDPRICRFAPFFLELLQETGFEVSPVLVFRNPLEVCKSLEKRNGMSRADAALLWLRHVLDAESSTRNHKRAIVSYNNLLGDWKASFANIVKQTGLKDFYPIDEIESQVEDFLSADLRHHTRKTADVLLDPVLRNWVGATYDALLILARNPGSKKAMVRLDAIAGEFNNASPVLRKLYDTAIERGSEIAELKEALNEERQGREALINEVQEKATSLEAERARIADMEQQLANAHQQTQDTEQLFRNSTSWKMTRPLRISKKVLKAIYRFPKTIANPLKRFKKPAQIVDVARTIKKGIKFNGGIVPTMKKINRIIKFEGVRSLRQRLNFLLNHQVKAIGNYQRWIDLYDIITDEDIEKMQGLNSLFSIRPLISIILPVYNTSASLLTQAIESVISQTYENWELCIADDCSTEQHVKNTLKHYAKKDKRIKVVYRAENGHISKASNSALEIAKGEWVALLDHDDLLAPHALFCVVAAINKNPNAKLFYSDEDKIDIKGKRHNPYFKCDWNYDLFLSHNLITHLGVYSREVLNEIGGFRAEYNGAQDYDLALRFILHINEDQIIHIPHVIYHWRVMPGSTAMSADEKPYAMLAGERAINDYLNNKKIAATAELIGFGYRVKYSLPSQSPLVSIIIPTRNAKDLVRKCIGSIESLTTYKNYEIILVDNGSDDKPSLDYFAHLDSMNHIQVLRDDRPFNYSALNNNAVKHANGSVIVLLNNDIEVISPDWLEEMVSLALQPGVGAVGAKLYYPDDTLQHGGVILGFGGVAGHAHLKFPRSSFGYFGRAALRSNFSAVTAACLAVRKDHFESVGGLEEQELKIAFNDTDFCLKLHKKGLRNVWTPFAELYHHESTTRGYETTPEKIARFECEKSFMLKKWKSVIESDPAYSPNLTLDKADFSLAFPPRVEKPWAD